MRAMDGLDDFEKALAAEKLVRENIERHESKDKTQRKPKHHHRHHRHLDGDEERDGHRHKRSRHTEETRSRSPNHRSDHRFLKDADNDSLVTEKNLGRRNKSQRDAWMTPSALHVDYTQRGARKVKQVSSSSKPGNDIKEHRNELNHDLQNFADGQPLNDDGDQATQREVSYTFGDSGAQWRMTKLKAVRSQAERSGQAVEVVAIERFGGLREYDNAREEEIELDRRKVYGEGYVGKEKPSGELFQETTFDMGTQRPHIPEEESASDLPREGIMEERFVPSNSVDSTTLNRMKARLMKAKLKRSPSIDRLEAEYDAAAAASGNTDTGVVVLSTMDNRMLSGTRGEFKAIDNGRGRQRGLVEENEDMTIEGMVREERRTKGQAGGEGMRMAERIAKDAKFESDLDYMDDNASKLAKRVQKSELNLKNVAINDYQKMAKILENCQLCHQEDINQAPIAPIVSLATRVYLTLPTKPELSEGGAVIVPIQHRTNLLECDDDEWEEIRNFMKCLTRMYHDQGRDVMFYENAAAPQRKMHAAMQAVPLPYSLGETAQAFFKEAILSSDEEWTQHKKIINTLVRAREGLGKAAFRRTIAKEMPYFHAWFELDGGIGHIVEDSNRWPRGDLFAREVIGGMLDKDPDVIKRQGRWTSGDQRVDGFRKRWRAFDWTRVLTDE